MNWTSADEGDKMNDLILQLQMVWWAEWNVVGLLGSADLLWRQQIELAINLREQAR